MNFVCLFEIKDKNFNVRLKVNKIVTEKCKEPLYFIAPNDIIYNITPDMIIGMEGMRLCNL